MLLLASLYVLFKYPPEFLGMKTNNPMRTNSGKVMEDVPVTISKNQLDNYQLQFLKFDVLNGEKQYLWKFKNQLIDSISKLQDQMKQQQLANNRTTDSISKTKLRFNELLDSISKLKVINASASLEVKKVQDQLKEYEKNFDSRMDSVKIANLTEFSKIYNNSNPAEFAKILEKIDEKDAARILKMMSKKKAGKIIELLSPERSRSILLLGQSN